MKKQAKIKLQNRINRLQEKLNRPVKYTIAIFKEEIKHTINYDLKLAEEKYTIIGSYSQVLDKLEELSRQHNNVALFKGRKFIFHRTSS